MRAQGLVISIAQTTFRGLPLSSFQYLLLIPLKKAIQLSVANKFQSTAAFQSGSSISVAERSRSTCYEHMLNTSVMIYHRGASLSEQHTDLLCTKQDLSHTSTFVDESSPKIARYCIRMPTAKTATLNVTTYA